MGTLLLVIAIPAWAAPNVSEARAYLTARLSGGVLAEWMIDFSFTTADTLRMTITPPGRDTLELTPLDPVPSEWSRFVLTATFETREAMLEAFPPGGYVVAVPDNGATVTLTVETDILDGFMIITSPADGSRRVDPSPVITRENTCGDCFVEILWLQGIGDDNYQVTQQAQREDRFPDHYTLDDFEGFPTTYTVLPNGPYILEAETQTWDEAWPSFSVGGDEFHFYKQASAMDRSIFEVPEPDSRLAAAAALASLIVLRRRAGEGGGR